MKNLHRNSIRLFFLFVSSFFLAQFNTIMPAQPQKQEATKTIESTQKQEVSTDRKEKKSWKKIFKITTKSDLKAEIDSLKIMLKNYSAVNDRKGLYDKKMKDSLILLTTRNLQQNKERVKKRDDPIMYDFVEEPGTPVSKIVMPLRSRITITSPYGTRTHPIFGIKKMHNGIDLKAHYENVHAVMDGIVTAAGWDSKGGGNYIKVKHFNRFETSYLHLSEMYYQPGEKVKAGFIIGKSGNTGNSTGPHLHFSVKEFGQSINPAHFLNDLIKVNNLITLYNEQ